MTELWVGAFPHTPPKVRVSEVGKFWWGKYLHDAWHFFGRDATPLTSLDGTA